MEIGTVFLELGAVIFGLAVVGHLAGRFGISPVPLYLLGGLAFGSGGLFPVHAPAEFIEIGAEIGVVLLLLMLGLEYAAEELVGNLRRQIPVGALDLVVNGLPGAALALILGWGPIAAFAMFGITAISSSGIVAKILTDLGRLGNRETPSVLSVLVIEDLAMAVFLPVLTAFLAATGPSAALQSVSVALLILAVALISALKFGRQVSSFVLTDDQEVLLLRVLGLALLVAGLAETVHVSAAVGAFLLGIALSGEVAEHAERMLRPLRDLFAAVFFVFFGLSTDPGALPPVLLPALGLALVGMITKLITGWFAARRAGVGTPGRIRAGTTLMARGEFSIVIAGLAAAAGLNDDLASLTAAYVLILAVAGPLAARVSDPLAKYVRLWRVRREGASETASPAAPAVRREEAEVVSEEASSASTTP